MKDVPKPTAEDRRCDLAAAYPFDGGSTDYAPVILAMIAIRRALFAESQLEELRKQDDRWQTAVGCSLEQCEEEALAERHWQADEERRLHEQRP